MAWAEKGTYGRMRRSLLLASLLRKEWEVSFAVKPVGKTLSFLIDLGFDYSVWDGNLPEAELYVIDRPRWEEEPPESSFCMDMEGGLGMRTLPPVEGGKFQVLSPRFRHFHALEKEIRPKGKKVLVALSTRASFQEVEEAVSAVEEEGFFPVLAPHFELPRPPLAFLRKRHPKLKIMGPVQDLARAMWKADMALISGFLKPFEAAAVGTPAVYWEEDEVSLSFQAQGLGHIYRPGILRSLYENPSKREELSKAGKEAVDALGLYRTAQLIRSLL